jgi:FMN phosphatase YigB (HAD superfamily)
MKTILVDAISVLVKIDGTLNEDLYNLLESYPNPKIVVTGANKEQMHSHNVDHVPYPVFTSEHNPEKSEPDYFKILIRDHHLSPQDLVYFDHSPQAVRSAAQIGIIGYVYNAEVNDILALKSFLDEELNK